MYASSSRLSFRFSFTLGVFGWYIYDSELYIGPLFCLLHSWPVMFHSLEYFEGFSASRLRMCVVCSLNFASLWGVVGLVAFPYVFF